MGLLVFFLLSCLFFFSVSRDLANTVNELGSSPPRLVAVDAVLINRRCAVISDSDRAVFIRSDNSLASLSAESVVLLFNTSDDFDVVL